ncbi:universal stress protein [Sediminibacillus halophilus]|uniref:Nucleotide-binding universal stress protein, UspA family n=1 Tax=Sediminibacillus halophilus TaxID=482461 RepID=A0A1G9TPC2_9BACI|nr:universal stress protein [Sediminibacillus halophilus]SDM49274.1 Nucleotide-binding universal stress protein, UspA family [Sediminibacillus halophilus]
MFKNILLATDGSEHSVRSADHAIQLAENFDGRIEVVYVVDGQTSKQDVLHNTDKYELEQNRRAKVQGVKEVLERSNVEYQINILHGEPGPTIVDHTNSGNFDCVVIGSRGLNNLQTMILGSVSHKVAKRVECPVLIVK